MIILGLIFLGFISSAYGTIIGAGGGFLFVPVLLMFYDISPGQAAATGLAVVFINSISSLPMFMRQGRVLFRTGLLIAFGAFPTTFLGGWLVKYSPEVVFYSLFSCLLIGLGLFLTFKKQPDAETTMKNWASREDHSVAWWKLVLNGSLLGLVSSFFGIGGGWLLVPILTYGFHYSIKYATATSIFSLSLYSLVGLIPSILDYSVQWEIVAWSGIGVLIGAQVGAILSQRMKAATISRLLAALVIVMGINMIFQI